MKSIPLSEAVPGMILGRGVVRNDGVLLAGEGSEITPALLRLMERLELKTVVVKTGPAMGREEKTLADINRRFSRVQTDPVLTELKNALLSVLKDERHAE